MEQKNIEMTEEMQIEEMAMLISGNEIQHCGHRDIAERLYNAGYRKQKEGEWIYVHTYVRGRCSICNHKMQYDNQPFCANCGAKMKGGAE